MLLQLANLRFDFDLIFGQLLTLNFEPCFGLYNTVTQLLDFVVVPRLVLYNAVTQLLGFDLVPSGSLRNVGTEFLDFGLVPSFRLHKAFSPLLDFGIIFGNEGIQPADRSGKQIGLGRFRSWRSLRYL